jgi:hypothetical protein
MDRLPALAADLASRPSTCLQQTRIAHGERLDGHTLLGGAALAWPLAAARSKQRCRCSGC